MLINRISHQRQLIAPGTTAAHVREVARQACLQKWLKLTLVFPAAQSIRDLAPCEAGPMQDDDAYKGEHHPAPDSQLHMFQRSLAAQCRRKPHHD